MTTYTVYKGARKNGEIAYIGTTVQVPAARFRWHRANGKNLKFTVLSTHETAEEMLTEELRLIQLHKPKLNKITNRKQNLNRKLTDLELSNRKGNPEWCNSCLKRRVNKGFTMCLWCATK